MNDATINQVNGAAAIRRIGATPGAHSRPLGEARPTAAGGFANLVTAQIGAQREVKLSAHAQARMQTRALELDDAAIASLQSAVDLAAAKGARQSLVMLDQVALIVNIPSRTVVTVMESDGARGTVFTNIDSAVVCGPAR